MCWFVTLAMADASRVLDDALAAARGALIATPTAASPTTALFPSGLRCVMLTRGGCSCELYSPPRTDGATREVDSIERLRARWLRQGWSAAKVARALADRAAATPRTRPPRDTELALRRFVTRLAHDGGSVMLFAHFHAGSPLEDAVGAQAAVALTALEIEQAGFPPDTLVTVRA